MIRNFSIPGALLAIIFLCLSPICADALTAPQILDKSASALFRSKGITADYTLTDGGRSYKGILKAKGKKFYISASGVQTWYDDSTQWNFNSSGNEVTISIPTPQEIALTSPYALIKSYKNTYNCKPLKSRIPGTYAIQLTPKSNKTSVKSAIIYIRTSDFMPCRLDVTARNGQSSSVIITSIKTGLSIPDNTFVFQKSKHPGVQIIDLR